MKFERNVEPGIIKVFDLQFEETKNNKIRFTMLSMRDDEFVIDQTELNLSSNDNVQQRPNEEDRASCDLDESGFQRDCQFLQ